MKHAFPRRTLLTTLVPGFLLGTLCARRAEAREDQPHMRRALDYLRSARSELQNATTDKGGHRNAAIKNVNQAIEQVERGIAFDNRHRRR